MRASALARPGAVARPAAVRRGVVRRSRGSTAARASATAGVEQKRPMCTPGVAKRALSLATARSHVATSWQPAAVAMPSTSAIVGTASPAMSRMAREHSPKSSALRAGGGREG